MSEKVCTYHGNREETLVAFVYNDMPPDERRAFEEHVARCLVCRGELAALGSLRTQLQEWTPPDLAGALVASGSSTREPRSGGWGGGRGIPMWAQVAAAALVMGVAAGIANLDVTVSRQGVSVRTGWSKRVTAADDAARLATLASRGQLAALERDLRRQIEEVASLNQKVVAISVDEESQDVLRKVRGIVGESERKQQTELALGLATLSNDVQQRRRADLQEFWTDLGKYKQRTDYVLKVNGDALKRNIQNIDSLATAIRVSTR